MTVDLLEELAAGCAPTIVPLTVDQLHEMIDAGIVPDGAPFELIDGLLVHKDRSAAGESPMTHNPRHATLVRRLSQRLSELCRGAPYFVQAQLPIVVGKTSAPEPDIAIIAGDSGSYENRHPGPEEILLVIEIAGSSLRYDRTTKQRLYASAGIPAYWIVILAEQKIEVYANPDAPAGKYSDRTEYGPGQSISLTVGQSILEVNVTALLA